MIVNVPICSYGHIDNLRFFCLKTKKDYCYSFSIAYFMYNCFSLCPPPKTSVDLLYSFILPKISTDVIKNTHYVLLRVVSSSVSKFDC